MNAILKKARGREALKASDETLQDDDRDFDQGEEPDEARSLGLTSSDITDDLFDPEKDLAIRARCLRRSSVQEEGLSRPRRDSDVRRVGARPVGVMRVVVNVVSIARNDKRLALLSDRMAARLPPSRCPEPCPRTCRLRPPREPLSSTGRRRRLPGSLLGWVRAPYLKIPSNVISSNNAIEYDDKTTCVYAR